MNAEQREYITDLMAFSGHDFPEGACWGNAQLLVLHDMGGRLSYWEGVGVGLSEMPVHHGWVVIDQGTPDEAIAEVTWREWESDSPLIEPRETFAYRGEQISMDAIIAQYDAGSLWMHLDPIEVFNAYRESEGESRA